MGARRLTAALAALAAFVVPSTTSAAESTSARAARFHERVSNAQVVLRGSPRDRPVPLPSRITLPRALAGAATGKRAFDVRTLGTIARAAIQTYTGVELAEPGLAEADQPVHVGFSGGDLDGDGLSDVLEFVVPPDDALALAARAGTDGAELWSFPLQRDLLDAYVQPLLNEAGGSDAVTIVQLFVTNQAGDGVCAGETGSTCLGANGMTYTWSLTVIDGATGAVRWARAWDGVVAQAEAFSFGEQTGAIAQGVVALNGFVAVMPSDDHDGDGVQDLVIDEIDLLEGYGVADVFTEDGGAIAAGSGFASATRATVVRASDGGVLGARASAGPGIAFLSPGVDGVGNATRDLLWDAEVVASPAAGCTFTAEDASCVAPLVYRRALEMIDGASLLTGWVVALDTPGWVLSAEGDVDGEGSDDLAYLRFGEQLTTQVLSGNDGRALWESDDVLLGPIDDEHVLAVSVDFQASDVVYVFTRRRGLDGAIVGSTEHRVPLPQDAFDLFIIGEFSRILDADGDGEHDAFGQITIYANDTTVDVGIERGRSGAPIFARHTDGERYAIAIDDANGDAIGDVLDITPVYHRRSLDLILAVLNLPAGAPAWSKTSRLFSDSWTTLALSGDMDGDGGSEILVSSAQREQEGLRAVLYPLSGLDGAKLWETGGPIAEPPPVPTGGIAGLMTGAGVPFQGACVSVTDPAGEEVAFQVASPDGTYLVAELDDGTYLVHFGDCFFGAFLDEWYQNAPSMEEATGVVVAGGAVTTGIDADLAPAS